MKQKEYTYADPTGGGDDVKLIAPVWAKPPAEIAMRVGEDGILEYFELEDEEGEDVL